MLSHRAPLAQRFAKDVMKRAVGLPFDEALRLESRSFHDLASTEDLAEGTAANRPPLKKGLGGARGGRGAPRLARRSRQAAAAVVPRVLPRDDDAALPDTEGDRVGAPGRGCDVRVRPVQRQTVVHDGAAGGERAVSYLVAAD